MAGGIHAGALHDVLPSIAMGKKLLCFVLVLRAARLQTEHLFSNYCIFCVHATGSGVHWHDRALKPHWAPQQSAVILILYNLRGFRAHAD